MLHFLNCCLLNTLTDSASILPASINKVITRMTTISTIPSSLRLPSGVRAGHDEAAVGLLKGEPEKD